MGSLTQSRPNSLWQGSGSGPRVLAMVLSRFIFKPEHISNSLNTAIKFFNDILSFTKHVVSSAICVIFISQLLIIIPYMASCSLILHDRVSASNMNRYGDNGQPWLTPLSKRNHLDVWPLFSTVADISWYRVLTYDMNLGPKLNVSKHLPKKFQLTESKAFSKSTDSSIPLILFLSVYIMISSIILMLFPMNLFLTYPVWSSSISWGKNSINLLAKAFAIIL